jgi:hypothetical protein
LSRRATCLWSWNTNHVHNKLRTNKLAQRNELNYDEIIEGIGYNNATRDKQTSTPAISAPKKPKRMIRMTQIMKWNKEKDT